MATKAIQAAFADRPTLLEQLSGFLDYYGQARAATNYQAPDLVPIVEDIAHYVQSLKTTAPAREESPAKKRKLNEGSSNGVADGNTASTSQPALVVGSAKSGSSNILQGAWNVPSLSVSFSVPQRKKYALQISANKKREGIRALNPTTDAGEFGIPWTAISHVLRLPVPDKAAASHNYCVFPKGIDGLSGDKTAEGYETMVWGAAHSKKKNEEDKPTESDNVMAMFAEAKAKVVEPTENEFASSITHPMRKGEKQYHVKAHRGSKEGYLFFLPNGIAFVFKKPLLFFSFDSIHSVSYTSILKRTFNLNISAFPTNASSDSEPMEIEFSMLDQEDFAGIDAYIKRHSLQDASMAETRKAKKYNVNKEAEGEESGGQLEKAEQEANQVADEEDDESDDENFDPGSEGESEGEGDSSDEEGDGDGGGPGEEMEEDDTDGAED